MLCEQVNSFKNFVNCKKFWFDVFSGGAGTHEEDFKGFINIKNEDIIGLKRNKTQNEITIIVNDVERKTYELQESLNGVKLFPTIAYGAHFKAAYKDKDYEQH